MQRGPEYGVDMTEFKMWYNPCIDQEMGPARQHPLVRDRHLHRQRLPAATRTGRAEVSITHDRKRRPILLATYDSTLPLPEHTASAGLGEVC